MNIQIFICRVLYSTCCLLLLSGCSANRKAIIKEHLFQTDSIFYNRKDSLYVNRLVQSAIKHAVQIKHITFSSPDSIGHQYVKSVSAITANTNKQQTEEIQEESVSDIKEEQQNRIILKTEKQTNNKWRKTCYWIIIGFGLSVMIGRFLWIRQR